MAAKGNEHRFSLGSKLLLSNALSMLNKNLTGFVQSLFSVQSICTVRKGSASRVRVKQLYEILIGCIGFFTCENKAYRFLQMSFME